MFAFSMPEASARLICDPGYDQEHVEIAIYDGRLQQLPLIHNMGRLELEVTPGAYKVEFRTGAHLHEKFAIVSHPGDDQLVTLDAVLPVASAAPVNDSSTSHEYQSEPASYLSTRSPIPALPGRVGGSTLFLFVRDHDEEASRDANPARGLSLHALNGTRLFDLSRASQAAKTPGSFGRHGVFDAREHWAALHADLEPGAYLLRLATGGGTILHEILHLRQGWQTQAFLIARTYGHERHRRRQADLARLSVFMARQHVGFRPGDRGLYLTEVALRALSGGGVLAGAERTEMLWAKFDNPMLGIYGGLLHFRRRKIIPELLREVFVNLYEMLGPHPDVLALGWGLVTRAAAEGAEPQHLDSVRDRLEAAGRMPLPPMLRAAWSLLAEASYARPGLIPPDTLSDRIAARTLLAGAWIIWPAEPEELHQGPLPPAAAPSPAVLASTFDKLLQGAARYRLSAPRQHFGIFKSADFARQAPDRPLFFEAEAAGDKPPAPPDTPAATSRQKRSEAAVPDDLLASLQHALDAIAERLDGDPGLAGRLTGEDLTALERRVALTAFPETDPLVAQARRKGSALLARRLDTLRPSATELGRALRLPAGTLHRAVLSLLAHVEA